MDWSVGILLGPNVAPLYALPNDGTLSKVLKYPLLPSFLRIIYKYAYN